MRRHDDDKALRPSRAHAWLTADQRAEQHPCGGPSGADANRRCHPRDESHGLAMTRSCVVAQSRCRRSVFGGKSQKRPMMAAESPAITSRYHGYSR